MCFTLRKKDIGVEPKVAEKDIKVWKVISNNGCGKFYNLYIKSQFEYWTRGYEYSETKPFDKPWSDRTIEGRCFHSNKREVDCFANYGEKTVFMIIPKGALYYENSIEYVSNRIIFPEL